MATSTAFGRASFAVVLFVVASMTGNAQGTPPGETPGASGGVLYLGSTSIPAHEDLACGGTPKRYQMSNDADRITPGTAPVSSPATPAYRCPTRFEFLVPMSFSLPATAHVRFSLVCDPASVYAGAPGRGAIRLFLTDNPYAVVSDNPLAPNPDIVSVDTGPVCTPTPVLVDVDVPAFNLTLEPGSVLILMVYFSYLSANDEIPGVHVLVGGDDPARLEAATIPPPGAAGVSADEDLRPERRWTADPYTADLASCGAFFLAPPGHVPTDATIGSAGNYCRTRFVAEFDTARTISGRVTVRFWYSCDGVVAGARDSFTLEIAKDNPANTIAPETEGGSFTEAGSCPSEPTEVTMETTIGRPTVFGQGSKLLVMVSAAYLAAPAGSTLVYYVGGKYPSSVKVHGLAEGVTASEGVVAPSGNATNRVAEPDQPRIATGTGEGPQDKAAPALPLASVVMLLLALVQVSRLGRGRPSRQ